MVDDRSGQLGLLGRATRDTLLYSASPGKGKNIPTSGQAALAGLGCQTGDKGSDLNGFRVG